MADLNAALIAFAGVLVGGYFNNFLAEDFRRFRDSQALAGALAGELESHAEAIPNIKDNLTKLHAIAEKGEELAMQEWPQPGSPVFEANVEKIGLLHPDLAKNVAYVYEQIRAFRLSLHLLSKHHKENNANWRSTIIRNAKACMERAENRGKPLVESLKKHAAASYWARPATIKQIALVAIVLGLMVWAFIHYANGSDHELKCATTFDNGTFTTACK